MSLYRNVLNVGAMTLLSRVLGFVRDMMMAVVLGAGPAADAFFAAFRFPNLFRRLFAEGAFNTAFVPLFSKALEQDGDGVAVSLASRIISWLLVVLVIVTVLAEIFMPFVLLPFVPGFAGQPEKYELTVLLTRICFPYLMLMSLLAAYGAILNSLGRFTAAALAPVLLNLVMIAFFVPLLLWFPQAPAEAAIWVAVATIAGGVAQLWLVYAAIRRTDLRPKLQWPKVDPEVRRFWLLAIPAVITGGITQVNIFIGTIIASGAESAISFLYYADRLYQLPLGIIGIAIGTVLLPELSRHLKGGRLAEAETVQGQSLLLSTLLSVPAAAALIAIAEPIVRVLFERGAFTALATEGTSAALVAFSLGLPAFVLIRVLQPGFFAREDTLTPTRFAAVSVAVNIGLSLALFPFLEHVAIALATTVAAWINVLQLGHGLWKRGHFRISPAEWRQQSLILLLSVLMAAMLYGLSLPLAPWLSTAAPLALQLMSLGLLICTGVLFYFSAIHLTGVQRLGTMVRRLRRRRA